MNEKFKLRGIGKRTCLRMSLVILPTSMSWIVASVKDSNLHNVFFLHRMAYSIDLKLTVNFSYYVDNN